MIKTDELDCIIFDLGKVIINLDIEATNRAFQSIFQDDYSSVFDSLQKQGFFDAYETGKISSQEFVETLVKQSKGKAKKQQIIDAWNAMLLDIPILRFDLLNWAKRNFKSYCLSNTNELHIDHIERYLKKKFQHENLKPFFHEVHYSHEMGMRKPEVAIFQALIEKHNLNPSRSLFIDDTAGHLIGAEKAGLKTFHLDRNQKIEDLLPFN